MATQQLIRTAIHKRKTPEVGDNVFVLIGKDRTAPLGGRQGVIKKIIKHKGNKKAIVTGLNMVKKFIKPTKKYPEYIIEVEAPISLSNLAVVEYEKSNGVKVKR